MPAGVLLRLMEFIKPADSFNLLLSGCSVTERDDRTGTTIRVACINGVEDRGTLRVEGTRNECQGPQFVMEFSGSEGRLIYKTTHKYRQTRTADKCGQKNIREANMDINERDHFRTFFPPILAETESRG